MTSSSAQRIAAASSLRQIGHDIISHAIDDGLLADIADTLADFSARVQQGPPRSRGTRSVGDEAPRVIGEGDSLPSWDERPISGSASPWSLEPDMRRQGDGVVAKVTFHAAHEGAPGRAHGGLVAALFDDILGSVMGVIGVGAFTGELTVRFRAPTPLHRELLCTCRLSGRDGRKLYLTGELTDQGTVLCTSTATFIVPKTPFVTTTFDPA